MEKKKSDKPYTQKKKKMWIKNLHDVLGNGNSANVLQDKCSTQRQCLIPKSLRKNVKKKENWKKQNKENKK